MTLNFKQFAEDGEKFLRELAGELGYPEDRNRAARILRSVLHTMRDIIPAEESVEFLAQLPMFLKAVYVEGWTLKQETSIRSIDEFISAMRMHHGTISTHDFESDDEAEKAIVVIIMMLRKYVSLGEMEDIRAVLPKKLKPLFNQVLML